MIDVPAHAPGPGEVAIRQTAIGVNFIDIYQRLGMYPLPFSAVLGVEGAGVIVALGSDVGGLRVGDRVAYSGAPGGAYAAERVIPVWRAVPSPATIPDELAAAGFIRGLTAYMSLTATYGLARGRRCWCMGWRAAWAACSRSGASGLEQSSSYPERGAPLRAATEQGCSRGLEPG